MRTILFVFGTTALVGVGGLLMWRPALALALALLGGAVSVWRMHRPQRAVAMTPAARITPRPMHVAPIRSPVEIEIAELVPAPAPAPVNVLQGRLHAAGWSVEPAHMGSDWIVAVLGGVRVALRQAPAGPRATGEDIFDAMAAKARLRAQYAAIVCETRPLDAVATLAKDSRIHIVNLARLESYLALAGSFKPAPAPVAVAQRA